MKKQINPTIKAHLIRGAFYLLLLLAVCAIPFALAQRNATRQNITGAESKPRLQLLSGPADSVLTHVQSQTPDKQVQPRAISPRILGGIDCDNAPGIVIHDDGMLESAYSADPALVTEVRFVDKFTPSSYPASYSSVCLDFVVLVDGPPTHPIDVVVFDDDGPGGAPGTLLGELNGQTATTHVFRLVGGQPPIWNSYDISSLAINVTSGSVYIGTRYVPPTPQFGNVYTSADESPGHPVGFAGGYWWNNFDGVWSQTQNALPGYRAMFIRAVETGGGGTPIELRGQGRKVGGINISRLRWSGATSAYVDVRRRGSGVIATTPNDGLYRDSTGTTGQARFTYKVCETGTQTCSNTVTVNFPP